MVYKHLLPIQMCLFIHFSGGTYIALFVVILIDFVGPEKLSSGSGLAIMCLGLLNLPIPSIYGKIVNTRYLIAVLATFIQFLSL